MLLSLILHAHSLRWTGPAAVMLGSSPTFISLWGVIRLLTALLPSRCYTYADDRLYSMYQRLVLCLFNTYTGVEVQLYGDVTALYEKKENVIFICNHQSTVDWVIADMLASAQGSIGSIRYILKDGLRFFPLYGFYFRQHSCVFVKKSGKFNQDKAEKQLAALKSSDIPVWMVIFPEGTRMNPDLPDVVEKSKQMAREQGFDEFTHVLTPRMKAFQLSLEQLQGHVDAVYDVTIAYSNTVDPQTRERTPAPGMPEFLSGASPEIHIHFERIPSADVPMEENDMRRWMFTRFQEKDRLISHFYSKDESQSGRFPGPSQTLIIPYKTTLPAFLFFGSCLTVLLATPEGRSLYWKVGVLGTVAGIVCMCIKS